MTVNNVREHIEFLAFSCDLTKEPIANSTTTTNASTVASELVRPVLDRDISYEDMSELSLKLRKIMDTNSTRVGSTQPRCGAGREAYLLESTADMTRNSITSRSLRPRSRPKKVSRSIPPTIHEEQEQGPGNPFPRNDDESSDAKLYSRRAHSKSCIRKEDVIRMRSWGKRLPDSVPSSAGVYLSKSAYYAADFAPKLARPSCLSERQASAE